MIAEKTATNLRGCILPHPVFFIADRLTCLKLCTYRACKYVSNSISRTDRQTDTPDMSSINPIIHSTRLNSSSKVDRSICHVVKQMARVIQVSVNELYNDTGAWDRVWCSHQYFSGL